MQPTSQPDFVFKIALIGNSGVGKSCFMTRFADDDWQFIESHLSTIGVDFKIRSMMLDDKHIKLQIWDTAGQERFRTITQGYYRGAHGILVVYDITDRRSFETVRDWMTEVQRYALPHCEVCLVANKSDLISQRVVSTAEGRALAEELGVPFIEASARVSTNVEEAFTDMARAIHKIHARIPCKTIGASRPGGLPSKLDVAQRDQARAGWASYCSIL